MADKPVAVAALDLPFSIEEYKARLSGVRARMAAADIDILLVTGPENLCYLSGYQTTGYYIYQALAVPLEGAPQFVTRRLEFTNVQSRSWIQDGYAVGDTESYFDATANCLEAMGGAGAAIGFDDQGFFLPAHILDGLRARMAGARLVPAGDIVERGRMIKSAQEIEYIRKAASFAVAGLEAGIAAIAPGATENQVAAATYGGAVEAGSEYVSSQPYVVSGPRAALTHATFEGNSIKAGEMVFFEVGGCHRRYGGAIMRPVSVGKPSAELTRIADAVIGGLNGLLDAVRAGATAAEVDQAGRGVVQAAGLGQYWQHRAAYSIGIGFPPGWGEGHIIDLKPGDTRVLEAGMTFHTVPNCIVPGLGAVGFSETFTVTADGVEVLTDTPRELRVV